MRKLSLKNKITALFLVAAIIPLIVVSVFQIINFRDAQTKNIQAQEMSLAKTHADNIDRWFSDHLSDIHMLIKRNPVLQNGNIEQIKPVLRQAMDSDASAENYIFVDKNGKGIDDKSGILDISDREYFKQAKTTLKPTISEVLQSKITGNNIVVIAVPVVVNNGFQGLLAATIKIDAILELMNDIWVADSGYGYLLSPYGTFITHIDEEYIGKTLESVMESKEAQIFKDSVLANDSGYMEYSSSSVDKMAAYSIVPNTGWRVVVTAPVNEVYSDVNRSLRTSAILIAVCVVAVVVLSILLSSSIVRPILAISAVMRKAAAGYLNERLSIKSGDEIGALAEDINHMLQTLRDIVINIKDKSARIDDSAVGLSATSQQIAASSQAVAQAMQDTSQGVSQQAKDLADISSVVKALEQALNNVYESLNIIKGNTNATDELSKQGARQLDKLIGSINDIRESYKDVAGNVQELDQNINGVNEITSTIANIANQTKMLSLNAAIEASRTGENGRGFSVVAAEIRALAERSKQFTENISRTIAMILENTSNVVKTTGEMENKLTSQMELVEGTIAAFQDIMNSINNMVPHIKSTYEQADDMIKHKDIVAERIGSISAVAEETSASTEEIAASMEQMTGSTQEIAATASALQGTAEQLVEQVSNFTV
ncbi:methyl-accepting chemotaxis protein [Mahella australiensis]|uniref:Methyl-accepting chemotaxis sensory transducer with Cache sensor n=1 Tax=Mahella australiensis (strain DSM 15567 / CIP 107919 / 50-1 BON) TaxID=697281 RepID=F3ZVB8_MAHA5|nr:methyl-accepting chemotaxis protein [Mahella australiensis]AEE95268.1 methyl-accepting chemotaxis sensory transducer with Cache sensor [Mahella australiensis 50-1 BON]